MQSLISPVTKAILVALFIFAILLILYVILCSYTTLLDMVRCGAEVVPGSAPLEQNDLCAHTWQMKPSQIIVA
ncbi:hypothetical protein DUI87_16177 [Hirundo rustica rustica]|uniref:Uncharacterized protein n=1 Tax=Hirundo rustica rustica TaxID=333673 RepID=A0A3M0K0I1_HIRRU|nr:hypothetical protein DUI87_16177 [Hirundo rustica rustica]